MALNERIKNQTQGAGSTAGGALSKSAQTGGATAKNALTGGVLGKSAQTGGATAKNALTGSTAKVQAAATRKADKVGTARFTAGSTQAGAQKKADNSSDIFREPWRYNRDGSRKTFDELSTAEVLTWISTMPQEEQGAAAADFEANYLKNPSSSRYDPYYTSYSNNDAARQMFGVNTFDKEWIDANRGYASYLTFTNESYTTPKKPGTKATEEEQKAYQWWLIANTYEETTAAAESEYAQLRKDVQERVAAMRQSGQKVSSDEILGSIDWSEYKTLQNLREASAAGNGRILNRPVQVGDASVRSMVNAAIRGDDITTDGDWLMSEAEWIKNRPTSVQGAIQRGFQRIINPSARQKAATQTGAKSDNPYANVTSVDYDPYYGQTSNNAAAKELFGVDTFDRQWMDDNRYLMQYIEFKDEDDKTPVKPSDKAPEIEKKAYQYWLIANTYEATTAEGEKELQKLEKWMQGRADYLGEGATAQEIVDAIKWDDYPTLKDMRETAAAGNARMVNRAVNAGDKSLLEMAKGITGESEETKATEGGSGSLMVDAVRAQADELAALVERLPEGSEERAAAQKALDALTMQTQGVSEEAAAKGNELGGWQRWVSKQQQANKQLGEAVKSWFSNPTAEENKEKAQAVLAGQQDNRSPEEIQAKRDEIRSDFEEKRLTEIYGTTETQEVESAQYNEYVGSMRAQYGLTATENWVKQQIAQLEISNEISGGNEESDALLAAYQEQLMLLENEQTQREMIEERVYEALRYGDTNYWGNGVLAYFKNRDFADAKSDGEMVPIEDYEAYLQYRLTPGMYNGDETIGVREEMAQYDQTGVWEGRGKLAADAAVQGTAAALNPLGESAEYVTYWLKTKLPEYEGLTREEIYAIDYDLQNFRAYNGKFEDVGMDAEERHELQEQHPVFAYVAAGIREVIKMSGQGALGGAIGRAVGDVAQGVQRMAGAGGQVIEGLSMLAGNGDKVTAMLQKAGSYLPFALDAYAGSFEQALNEGATADQAMLTGVLNGAVSGTLSGFAVDKMSAAGKGLFNRLLGSKLAQKAAADGTTKAVLAGFGDALTSLLETAINEGAEEALEEVFGGLIAKGVYDRDRAWFGDGGVIDPSAMLQSGIAGAVAGGMFPVVSGFGSAVGDIRRQRAAEAQEAELKQQAEAAAQHIFELTAGYSGELGEAAQKKAESIIERIANGETVDESEFEELTEIAARSASVEEATEAIAAESGKEIEAAQEEARKSEEAAVQAEAAATEAKKAFDEAKAVVKPMLKALNDGTASYADPTVKDKLGKAYENTKAAKGTMDKANTEAQAARTAADNAAQAAQDTESAIRSEARTQAQTQVDAEIKTEKNEAKKAKAEKRKAQKKRPKGQTQPGVRKMFEGSVSSDKQTQIRILDAIGREYGIEFDVVDSIGKGISAMYDPSQAKVITVALDASEGAIVQAGVHEMVHYIKAQSADAYDILSAAVLREIGKKVDSEGLEMMIAERQELYRERTGQELTREQAIEEIVAEAVPTVFTDQEAMARLVKENRTLVEQIRDFFIDFANRLKEIAEKYWEKNDRYEIAALIDEADSLREIAYALDDALDAVYEGADGSGEATGTKFSLSAPVEEAGDLVALHNLNEAGLVYDLDMGGFPAPSIAVIRASQGHSMYGAISVVLGKDSIDPQQDKRNKLYGADAWTPTQQNAKVEYEVDEKASGRIYSEIDALARQLPEAYKRSARSIINNVEYALNAAGGESGLIDRAAQNMGMKAAFLTSQGQTVTMEKTTKTTSGISAEEANKLADVLALFDFDTDRMLQMPIDEIIDKYGIEIRKAYGETGNITSALSGMWRKARFLKIIRRAAEFMTGELEGQTVEVDDEAATDRKINESVDEKAFKAWLGDLFGGITARTGILKTKVDPYTPSGNRRSFKQLHYDLTVDNVVKAMFENAAERGAGYSGVGLEGLAAVGAESYKNIDAMRADKGRLYTESEEDRSERHARAQETINAILDELRTQNGSEINSDDFATAIMETAKAGKKTAAAIRTNFGKLGVKITPETAKKLAELYKEAATMPTGYFEAKPQRAVSFDEVKAVIVPDNLQESTMTRLREAVSDVLVYPSGDEDARLKALNGLEGVRFNIAKADGEGEAQADESPYEAHKDFDPFGDSAETGATEEERQRYRAELRGEATEAEAATEAKTESATETEAKTEGGKKQQGLAGKIVRKYKSDIERGVVRAALERIEQAYNNGEEEAAEQIAAQIAAQIAEQSRNAVSEETAQEAEKREVMREQYAEVRKTLKTTGISLTEVQKQEAANAYGSYNDFRRSMMGNVLIKNDGISLDAMWNELSEQHPEIFPADTNEGDMVAKLAEFVEQVRPSRKVIGDMDAGTMAAAISLELQSAVLSKIGKDAESVAAEMAAQALKEKGLKRESLRREARREERKRVIHDIAEEVRKARDAKDDAAMSAALDKYRETMGKALKGKSAEILEIGMDIREKQKEIARIQHQIELLQNDAGLEDSEKIDGNLRDTTQRIEQLEAMLANEQKSLKALHRQQMMERVKSRLDAISEDSTEVDEMRIVAEEIAQQDIKDRLSRLREEHKSKVAAFSERMRTKQMDYSQISTLTTEDIDEFFGDMLGEMKQNSRMAKDFERNVSAWKYQLDEDKLLYNELRREMADARSRGDARTEARLSIESEATRDRIDVLQSRVKFGESEAKRLRKSGAQSMAQALREGRLAQPIMEYVIAACAGAKRQSSAFNNSALAQNALEATRLNWATIARVWDDLFGDAAPIMRAIYYDPVTDNETSRQKWIAAWRDKIRALKLTESESELVQRIGENVATLEEKQNATQKVLNAVEVFRGFYDEAYEMASKSLERNGYNKPGRINNYFPHFNKPLSFWETLGIPTDSGSLPTVINGLTETFKPGRQYSRNLKERTGARTDYDALFGFEDYIESMSNVIYHTDDIQRLRQLESEIRIAAESGLLDGNKQTTHLSEFVKWLREYTNLLAGKKSQSDRGAESTTGRHVYRAITKMQSVKGASAVAGNLASALTNFIPITQVAGEHPIALIKAVGQTFFSHAVSKSNLARSNYIARKYGSDSVIETKYSKTMKVAGAVFEMVDHIATEIVVNTYYQQNLSLGMDNETAMRSADAKAARLMGDRSKGAMPNIYASKLAGFATQFQYEIANQSQHFRKDIWRGKSLNDAFLTLIGTAITGHLFNNLMERVIGRRSAADPIQMAVELYEVWQDKGEPLAIAQTIYNNVSEMVPYVNLNGRIAAFEGFTDVIDAFTSGDSSKFAYAVSDAIFSAMPMGGQIKKTIKGAESLEQGGVYNYDMTQLKYVVGWDEALQALIFGPSATQGGRAYFGGDAPGLTKAQTTNYEQAKERGVHRDEAFTNEVNKAAAEKLMGEVRKAETVIEENEARKRAGIRDGIKEVDTEKTEQQRSEAQALRSEAIPGEELSDYWYERRDSKAVKAGIELWRESGDNWSLPKSYEAETSVTIDKNKYFPGEKIAAEANRLYAEGYEQIMGSVQVDKLDEEGREALKGELDKLKREVDKWVKDEISSTQGV